MRALVIPANGTPEFKDLEEPILGSIQKAVGGEIYATVEQVPLRLEEEVYDLLVDEDGISKRSPYNLIATTLATFFSDLPLGSMIFGNAVILGDKNYGWVEVPEDLLKRLRAGML